VLRVALERDFRVLPLDPLMSPSIKVGKSDCARALKAAAQENMMAMLTSTSAQMMRGAKSHVGSRLD